MWNSAVEGLPIQSPGDALPVIVESSCYVLVRRLTPTPHSSIAFAFRVLSLVTEEL